MEYLETNNYLTELLDFGTSTRELPSAIWYLVLKGRLKNILQLSQEQRKWPANYNKFLEQVYWAIKSESIFKALNAKKEVPKSVFAIEEEFVGAPWVKSWHLQINKCRDLLEASTLPSKIPLDQSIMELVSILVCSLFTLNLFCIRINHIEI